jgi:hypothetical protein
VHIALFSGNDSIGRCRRDNIGEESNRSGANWWDGESGIVMGGSSCPSVSVVCACVGWFGRREEKGEEIGGWVRETVVAWEGRMWACCCSSAVEGVCCVNWRMVLWSCSSASCVSLDMWFKTLLSICDEDLGAYWSSWDSWSGPS